MSAPGTAASTLSFVQLEVEDTPEVESKLSKERARTEQREPASNQLLAAEVIHPGKGCSLRIYNGADQSTLSALVAALAIS